jgi:hypothetical protein
MAAHCSIALRITSNYGSPAKLHACNKQLLKAMSLPAPPATLFCVKNIANDCGYVSHYRMVCLSTLRSVVDFSTGFHRRVMNKKDLSEQICRSKFCSEF